MIRITKRQARDFNILGPERQRKSKEGKVVNGILSDSVSMPRSTAKCRYTLVIPGFVPTSLNKLTRGTWRDRIKLAESDKEIVAYYSREIPKSEHKRRVSVVISKPGRKCDVDAYYKSLLDCLVACCLLVSDSPAWCELGEWRNETGLRQTTVILEDV